MLTKVSQCLAQALFSGSIWAGFCTFLASVLWHIAEYKVRNATPSTQYLTGLVAGAGMMICIWTIPLAAMLGAFDGAVRPQDSLARLRPEKKASELPSCGMDVWTILLCPVAVLFGLILGFYIFSPSDAVLVRVKADRVTIRERSNFYAIGLIADTHEGLLPMSLYSTGSFGRVNLIKRQGSTRAYDFYGPISPITQGQGRAFRVPWIASTRVGVLYLGELSSDKSQKYEAMIAWYDSPQLENHEGRWLFNHGKHWIVEPPEVGNLETLSGEQAKSIGFPRWQIQ